MITGPFPSELEQLVSAEMQAGSYPTAADVLLAGVRMLRKNREEFQRVKALVQEGLDQYERGEYHEYDDESLAAFFEDLKRKGRERLQAESKSAT